jgi:hypothetical protein
MFCGEGYYQNRAAVLPAAVKGELGALPQGLEHESGTFCYGGYPRRHG